MTHNELLARLDQLESYHISDPALNALRAVVELHKQKSSEYFDKDVCLACSPDIDIYEYYPCPTIQAIEKKLM